MWRETRAKKPIANEQWLTSISFPVPCTAEALKVTEGEAATPPLLRRSPNDAASLHASERETEPDHEHVLYA